MTLIDRVLLSRAEEQTASQLVRQRDRDEPKKLEKVCRWCCVPVFGRAEVCASCRSEGATATQCKWGCGRYVTRTDQTGPENPALRNVCKSCRTKRHQVEAL